VAQPITQETAYKSAAHVTATNAESKLTVLVTSLSSFSLITRGLPPTSIEKCNRAAEKSALKKKDLAICEARGVWLAGHGVGKARRSGGERMLCHPPCFAFKCS